MLFVLWSVSYLQLFRWNEISEKKLGFTRLPTKKTTTATTTTKTKHNKNKKLKKNFFTFVQIINFFYIDMIISKKFPI